MAIDNLDAARDSQRFYADKNRRNVFSQVNELLMLKSKCTSCTRRSHIPTKWPPSFMGPRRVLEHIFQVANRIKLPPYMCSAHYAVRVSNLIHVVEENHETCIDMVMDSDGHVEQ